LPQVQLQVQVLLRYQDEDILGGAFTGGLGGLSGGAMGTASSSY
jgi:hypothetical protein